MVRLPDTVGAVFGLHADGQVEAVGEINHGPRSGERDAVATGLGVADEESHGAVLEFCQSIAPIVIGGVPEIGDHLVGAVLFGDGRGDSFHIPPEARPDDDLAISLLQAVHQFVQPVVGYFDDLAAVGTAVSRQHLLHSQ